ncbi:hypothetical protein C8R43DRAFT_932924 [Mycena crocata]|nr:hypothetical protein C8R43DRAFT_932924 [Mycena crocata]
MPKEHSTQVSNQKTNAPARRKGGDPRVKDVTMWWRKSKIRKDKKVSRTLALRCYKLDAADLEGLDCTNSPICVKSPSGGSDIINVALYNERAVERAAWTKYGGPEEFELHLKALRKQYMHMHPLGCWEFQQPEAYRHRGGPDFDSNNWSLEYEPPSQVYNAQCLPQQQLPARKPRRDGALFSYEPLLLHTSVPANKMPSVPFFTTAEMQLQDLQREFMEDNCGWLWDAGNRVLAFPGNIHEWAWVAMGPDEKADALRALLSVAKTYPRRPTALRPLSAAYDLLHEVLDRAPSWGSNMRGRLVLHEWEGGKRTWRWDAEYTEDLFAALVTVITYHGCGTDGWMGARWEVYDTFSRCLEGWSYREGQWHDAASDWLKGYMELPAKDILITRQDNKSAFGSWYNSLLPQQ